MKAPCRISCGRAVDARGRAAGRRDGSGRSTAAPPLVRRGPGDDRAHAGAARPAGLDDQRARSALRFLEQQVDQASGEIAGTDKTNESLRGETAVLSDQIEDLSRDRDRLTGEVGNGVRRAASRAASDLRRRSTRSDRQASCRQSRATQAGQATASSLDAKAAEPTSAQQPRAAETDCSRPGRPAEAGETPLPSGAGRSCSGRQPWNAESRPSAAIRTPS